MDNKSLEILEFRRIREIVAGFCSFSASRELALDLQPLTDYADISLLLSESAEARRLLTEKPGFSIGGIRDIREAARLAGRGGILETHTVADVQATLRAIHQVRHELERVSRDFPLLWNIADALVELQGLENDIARCISPDGEMLDSASPKLASVRQRLKLAREQLLARLQAIMRTPKGSRIVQEPVVVEREGRYVIPVKDEFHKEIKGIVHDVSNTGATVFIEPYSTIDLGNEIRELSTEERREVERILRELSNGIGSHETDILSNIDLSARLDLALAKAKYARKFNAVEPVLGNGARADTTTVLKLVNARHPLLGDKAVPLSLEIGDTFTELIITGPNTGGKTVALKTIGLLSLMAQSGLPIPAAADSCVPVFDDVFADIGDEQSIEQTLSTFSWHIGNIVRIINNATARSLVLLDELGTSTDPAEGSALACSLLLHFLGRKTITVATTHFGELKAFAHATAGMRNASMEFDPVTLAPTFRLVVGVPGGSNALATASRLGLREDIIAQAREMLSSGSQELENLISSLAVEKQKVETARYALEKEKWQVERHDADLKDELQRFRNEEQRIIQDARDRVVSEVADLQRDIRDTITDLRKSKSKEAVEQARRSLAAVQEKLKDKALREPSVTAEADTDSIIGAGDTVLLKEANLQATVLRVSEETRQVEVQAGLIKIALSLNDVQKLKSAAGVPVAQPTRVTVATSGRPVPAELDLRGKRAEEVELAVDNYLNDASLSGRSEVRIIHGFGTGVVRKIVRDMLAAHSLVKSFQPGGRGEGGDGATVVRL